mmetsp:Transcript_85950/g.238081  ORF Transcript_85950/g.238081 Transcript_85950/m.238081 type:complete len:283 (+) Transcript_85950:295-1143(+)
MDILDEKTSCRRPRRTARPWILPITPLQELQVQVWAVDGKPQHSLHNELVATRRVQAYSITDRICTGTLHVRLDRFCRLGMPDSMVILSNWGLAFGANMQLLRSRKHLLLVTGLQQMPLPSPGHLPSDRCRVENVDWWLGVGFQRLEAGHLSRKAVPPKRQCDVWPARCFHLQVEGDGVARRQRAEAHDAVADGRIAAMCLADFRAYHDATAVGWKRADAAVVRPESDGLHLAIPAHELPEGCNSLRHAPGIHVNLEGYNVIRCQYLRIRHRAVYVHVAIEA